MGHIFTLEYFEDFAEDCADGEVSLLRVFAGITATAVFGIVHYYVSRVSGCIVSKGG